MEAGSMSEGETEYAIEREAQERAAAEAATYPGARDIHLSLAERYADRADAKPQALEQTKDSAGGVGVKQHD
jgi:hypothetical protein